MDEFRDNKVNGGIIILDFASLYQAQMGRATRTLRLKAGEVSDLQLLRIEVGGGLMRWRVYPNRGCYPFMSRLASD